LSSRRALGRVAVTLTIATLLLRGAAGAQTPAGFGVCIPRSNQPRDQVGCFIIAEEPQGQFGPAPVFWHLTRFSSRDAAVSARPEHGTVLEGFGHTWLMTIGDSASWPRGGAQAAVIGPLPIRPGISYKALYMQASMRPGMKSAIHRHSGPEAWYTLSGETCLETPSGTQVGRANGPPVVIPGGLPMELTATGTTVRRSLVLILHDATQPPTTVLNDWKPRHLCERRGDWPPSHRASP
jgi:quercetin dioxygenase-like cupin family protein